MKIQIIITDETLEGEWHTFHDVDIAKRWLDIMDQKKKKTTGWAALKDSPLKWDILQCQLEDKLDTDNRETFDLYLGDCTREELELEHLKMTGMTWDEAVSRATVCDEED